MAANNPPVLAVIPALAANNPLFGEDPVYLGAGEPLVSATASFMDWQLVVAAAGVPAQVSAPFHRMLFAFGIRCKISPVPANLAAARALNPFTMRFHPACWSRVLTELSNSGLAPPGTVYYTVAAFHEAIVGLQLQNPMNLYIGAADWATYTNGEPCRVGTPFVCWLVGVWGEPTRASPSCPLVAPRGRCEDADPSR